MINDPTENLYPHINNKQVNNVIKTIQKNLDSQSKFYWKNNDQRRIRTISTIVAWPQESG